ncbi:MAG: RNA polymerase sigma factor [Acidimicrobiales bacterium]|nr:RNA polymerase sigma factor [Acidimicrobiales bacterium]
MDPVTPAADLVRAAQTGDHRAFSQLIRDCDERMRRLAFRLMGSAAAMDDALQDAYLKAYRKLDTYNGSAAFSTWLYTIVYRTCLDHLRRRRNRRETDIDLVAESVSVGADISKQAVDADALAAALADLPADQCAAVLLVDGDGLSYAEAASVLDVREGTVASRLNRAHARLRTVLGDPGGDLG